MGSVCVDKNIKVSVDNFTILSNKLEIKEIQDASKKVKLKDIAFKKDNIGRITSGEILATDESTLKLKSNTTYELGFKYRNRVDNLYFISIRSNIAGELFKENLTPGTVADKYEEEDIYIRDMKEFKYKFTTGDFEDYYLALDKREGFDRLAVDDLYIKDLTA